MVEAGLEHWVKLDVVVDDYDDVAGVDGYKGAGPGGLGDGYLSCLPWLLFLYLVVLIS